MPSPTDRTPGSRATKNGGPVRRATPEGLFRPVSTRKTFEDVLGQIVDLIRSGQLKEGDDLPGERKLADLMEVSRPTIRLAIAELSKAGVVEVRPGRAGGIRIASMWIPDSVAQATEPPKVDETFELLEARRALEPRVAQLAALRGTEADFDAMRSSIELQRANSDDRRRAVQAELMFHRLMWQAGGNIALEEVMRDLMAKLETVFDMALRTTSDRDSAVDIHENTLGAIMRGDPTEIEAAMDQHMAYLEQIAEDAFGRRRLREIPAFLGGSAMP